ncbi:MAG: preprotein translocase subunit SecE [bacterium]|nr:preprotein translocase subunit SecE [bacterium]
MGKRAKINKKRGERRERAKLRTDGINPNEEVLASEESVEEAGVTPQASTQPEEHRARLKRAPKTNAEEEEPNAWERMNAFFSEVKIEAKKINWPTRDDTWKSTWVTIFVILFLSLFMGLASFGMSRFADRLFNLSSNIPAATAPVDPGSVPTTVPTSPPPFPSGDY